MTLRAQLRRALAVTLALAAVSSMAAAATEAPTEAPDPVIGSRLGEAREATINLQVAREVRDRLRDAGIRVLMTRNTDQTLQPSDRVGLANGRRVDAFVSIHHNASTVRSAKGAIVFRSIRSDGSWRLGRAITDAFREVQPARSSSMTTRRGCCGDYYYQLRLTRMPAVLVEGGFVSNPEEGRRLADDPTFRGEIAEAIARGILTYQRTLGRETAAARDPGIVLPGANLPATDVVADALGATRVRLRFTTPDVDARYRIYRDGALIDEIGRAAARRVGYTDRTAAPGQTYIYEVRTTDAVVGSVDLWRESVGLPVEVTTPAMSIVLDPGHGGRDPGAIYRY